jgi:CRP-like cAMP-binding protein
VTNPRLLRTSRELFLSVLSGGSGDLEPWVIDRMTSVVEEEDVEPGKRLFAQGELPEFIFFVLEGRLRLERPGSNPWTFEGRSAIGVFDALLERPHTRTAVAETNLHLLKLRAEHWLALLEDSFGLARAALANSVSTVAAIEERQWATQAQPRGSVAIHASSVERPLGFIERVAILAEIPFVRSAGIQVLVELAESVKELTFQPGDMLFARGEPSGGALLVLQGEVVGERNDPALQVLFGPGSFVGGVASLGNPIAAWKARAATYVRVLSMSIEDWFDLMEEHFDLVRSALSALALRREAVLDELAEKSAELRVDTGSSPRRGD